MIIRKSAQEIETMARAGAIVAGCLELLRDNVRAGVTTAGRNDRAAAVELAADAGAGCHA